MSYHDEPNPVDVYNEREAVIDRETDALWDAERLRQASGIGYATHNLGRFGIRFLRVACGVVFGLITWACLEHIQTISRRPMTVLTLADIGMVVLLGVVGYVFGLWAFKTAFGAKPTDTERRDAMRGEVANAVYRREQAAQAK